MDKEGICRNFAKLKLIHQLDFDLKPEQLDLIHAVVNRRHSMGILGTGFGKSIIYVVPPLILNLVEPAVKHMSLVISPLRSLMMDQVGKLDERGVKAAAILTQEEMTSETKQGIQEGDYSVVFASPEAINTDTWSAIVRSRKFRSMVSLVAIDEAHCVVTWGTTFREDYLKITWLHAVMDKTPMLFLTATCTEKIRAEIFKQFGMDKGMVQTTAAIPNRPNIFLSYKSHPAMRMEVELLFYMNELSEKGVAARKCIIYTQVNPAGEIFEEMINHLKEKAYTADGKRLVDVFVAKTSEEAKEEILKIFPSPSSSIRCLIASAAFGMGVDIPDVDLIIHWGVSSSVLQYWQEVGRCGRDGRPGNAILLATPYTLSDRRITEDNVREMHEKVMQQKSCIRLAILGQLYLECMNREDIKKISDKEPCGKSCMLGQCVCDMCSCCSHCQSECLCYKATST